MLILMSSFPPNLLKMSTNKDCLIYLRTSTLTNVKGDSVKRQKSSIMKWVNSNGYSVKGEYWDIESGSKDTMDRPEFMRMIYDSEKWESKFWFSQISLVCPETSLFRSQPLDF